MKPLLLLFATSLAALAGFTPDIEFARPEGTPLLLDASIPDGNGPFPAVICIHGGGWTRGDKQTYIKPAFEPLSQAGFAWFSINYRLAPQVRYPMPVDDVESAIRWVKANAAKYHVDTKRIALLGESAGGYLVAMAGARNRPDTRVAAVVDFYGPHDLNYAIDEIRQLDTNKLNGKSGVADLIGFEEWSPALPAKLRAASPITYVRKGIPPFLFLHGSMDEQVAYRQSPMMCEAIRKAGGTCKVITIRGGKHGMGSWEKDPAMSFWKADMIAWLRETLHVQSPAQAPTGQ